MIQFRPLGTTSNGAFEVAGQWRGQLLFSNDDRSIQKIVPCVRLCATQDEAKQDARNLHAAIVEQQGPFEFSGFVFSVDSHKWENGYRGHILLSGTPGYPNRFPNPFDLQCESYQATREDALCEAYAEAIRLIEAGIVVQQLKEDGTSAA